MTEFVSPAQPIIENFLSKAIKERRKILRRKEMRVFIYKYSPFTNIQHADSVICESKLWLSTPDAFNDPFDMKWKYLINPDPKIRRARIKQIIKDNPDISGKLWKERKAFEDKLMANPKEFEKRICTASKNNVINAGVACFSEDPRSILMWSHYANFHQGIAFQFDVSLDPEVFLNAVRVNYSDDYPSIEWTDLNQNALKPGLLTKFKKWEYEKERRLIKPNFANNSVHFNRDALTGIILGCKFNDYSSLSQLLKKRKSLGYGVPQIFKDEQSDKSYRLILKR